VALGRGSRGRIGEALRGPSYALGEAADGLSAEVMRGSWENIIELQEKG
jgi:hypothetical protein